MKELETCLTNMGSMIWKTSSSLRIGDLFDAGMTLMQVHHFIQLATEASEADHSQDASSETAQIELSLEQPKTRDGHGHKRRFNDEEIQRALDHIGADDATQETLKEYGITRFEETLN